MLWLPILAWVLASQASASDAIDVSTLVFTPATVIDLDLGQLKGDLRQIGWSADAAELYVQTVEGNPPKEKAHHYIVSSAGGRLAPAAGAPEWALEYWAVKSDRTAPGRPELVIDAKQTWETVKIGTGSAGAAATTSDASRAGGGTVMSPENIDRESQQQKQNVWRFTLLGETISEFENTRPLPGLMFGWGPRGSGAIAYTDTKGHLLLLDASKRRQQVADVKDAILPAWSPDGARLAYAVKTGRRKYQLVWCTIAR